MNERLVVDAVYTVIDGVRETLVEGFIHQGVQREIDDLLRSSLTPPKQGMSITINCTGVRETSLDMSNIVQGKDVAVYEMELHVVDIAFPQLPDPAQTPYETMHQDFRLLIARLSYLIRKQTVWWPTASATPKFRLMQARGGNDRLVRVDNRTAWYDEGTGPYPVLYSVIAFTLVEECVDTGELYD